MMNNCKTSPSETTLEKYPLHIQQALFLIAAVLRRINAKKLDKGAEKCLIINGKNEGDENHEN